MTAQCSVENISLIKVSPLVFTLKRLSENVKILNIIYHLKPNKFLSGFLKSKCQTFLTLLHCPTILYESFDLISGEKLAKKLPSAAEYNLLISPLWWQDWSSMSVILHLTVSGPTVSPATDWRDFSVGPKLGHSQVSAGLLCLLWKHFISEARPSQEDQEEE